MDYNLNPEAVFSLQLFIDRDVKFSRKTDSRSVEIRGAKIVEHQGQLYEEVEIDACTPCVATDASRDGPGVYVDVAFSEDGRTLNFGGEYRDDFELISPGNYNQEPVEYRLYFAGARWALTEGNRAKLWVLEDLDPNADETHEKLPGVQQPDYSGSPDG